MRRYLLFAGIFFTSLLPHNTYSAEWKKLGKVYVHDMVVMVYIDDITDQNDDIKDGYKSLWVRFELPKNLPSNIDEKEYRIREEKYHYHCSQKLFAVSHLILLDREEATVYDSGSFDPYKEEYSKSWKLISPKSGPDFIYHYLCSSKTETASDDNTPEISSNTILPKPVVINEFNNDIPLDIKSIRWARHEDFERIVFDIFRGNDPVNKTRVYKVTKLEDENKLRIDLEDMYVVSATFPDIKDSRIVKKIYKERPAETNDKGKLYIFIDYDESSEYNSFTMQEPGRIVIDFREKKQ